MALKEDLRDNKKCIYWLLHNNLAQGKRMKDRITLGFHRLGLVISVIITISGLIQVSDKYQPSIFQYMLPIIGGIIIYALFKSLAWIITGFMKDWPLALCSDGSPRTISNSLSLSSLSALVLHSAALIWFLTQLLDITNAREIVISLFNSGE